MRILLLLLTTLAFSCTSESFGPSAEQADQGVCDESSACPENTFCSIDNCLPGAACCPITDGCFTSDNLLLAFPRQSAEACGTNANVCSACPNSQSCRQGSCYDARGVSWFITLDSAVIAINNDDGVYWDANEPLTDQYPDPYVLGKLGGDRFYDWWTATFFNNLMPFWNESKDFIGDYQESDLLAKGMDLEIRDADSAIYDYDRIGKCHVPLTLEDLQSPVLKVQCGSALLSFHFTVSE